MRRIGILGGSFDPIHRGHLQLAKDAKKKFKLNHIYLVPAFQNPLKLSKPTAAKHRLSMIRIALKKVSYLRLSLFELNKQRPVYTYETLQYYRKRFSPKTEIYFICGSDVLKHLRKWKRLDKITKLAQLVIAERAGENSRSNFPKKNIPYETFKMTPVKISSTSLRQRNQKLNIPKKLLPIGVYSYIQKNHLYVD